MAWVNTDFDTYVKRHVMPQLHSSKVNIKPVLAMFAGGDVAGRDRIGDPQFGAVIGGRSMGEAQKRQLTGARLHEYRYQRSQSDTSSNVEIAGETPTASGFFDTHVGTSTHAWHQFMTPWKIPQDDLDDAENDKDRIKAIMEECMGFPIQMHLEQMQDDIWNGTLTSTQQNTNKWPNLLGIRHQVSDGSTDSATFATIGRVDRTVETELQANVNTAANLVSAGYLTNTVVTLDLIRKLKTISAIGALSDKAMNAGDICLVAGNLWNVLAAEADSNRAVQIANNVPELAKWGFKLPVILMDNTTILMDNDAASGEMLLLTSKSWSYEIQRGHNMKFSDPQRKWVNEEGGAYYQWGNIETKHRLVCREPWLQTKCTDLTVS